MTIPRGSCMRGLRWAACGLMLALLPSCTPDPIDASPGLGSGIWMLSDVTRERDGETLSCWPMLTELTITEQSVTLGRRALPCNMDEALPEAVSLQRNGTSLLSGGYKVGTLLDRSMEIDLPNGAGRISWDMDRPDAPYRETVETAGTPDVYSAKPVLRPDSTPVAISFTLSKVEDKPVLGRLRAATLPGARLVFKELTPPHDGELTLIDLIKGDFRVSPEKNYWGYDEFTFMVANFGLESEKATVGITYAGRPDPPVVQDSFVEIIEDTSVDIFPDVYDPDGDLVTLSILTPPQHGQAVIDKLTIVYTPDPEFSGQDTLEYVADDGTLQSEPATVDLSVWSINDPPVAVGQTVHVTSGSATVLPSLGFDVESSVTEINFENMPVLGRFVGGIPHLLYVPNPGVQAGSESLVFRLIDVQSTFSFPATLNIIISPGDHPCELLHEYPIARIQPELMAVSKLYFRTSESFFGQSKVWATNGTVAGTLPVMVEESDTAGFDNSVGGVHRTTFFNVGPTVYFTTSTNAQALRLYRAQGFITQKVFDIPRPGNDYPTEPSVGEAYVNGAVAYLPVQWRNTAQEYACQVWKVDVTLNKVDLLHAFPLANGPCSGLWTMAGEQYMFVGSSLMKFSGMQAPPVLVKDLGKTTAMPWMVQVGDKLFFQTRTSVGADTQIDLWKTNGTEVGTQVVKQLESAFFEFNVIGATAFQGKLYFGHRKSLWSSDGTEAGTNIVTTLPVSNLVGDGALGTLSVIDSRLHFLASSDGVGREPWISDGTGPGTKLLRDIHVGMIGSTTASTNSTYFHGWNGKVFFSADDGVKGSALWSTDGTSVGTNAVVERPVTTIMGILGTKMLVHDGFYLYAMQL